MAQTFSLASDTSLAYSPLHVVVPFGVEAFGVEAFDVEGGTWEKMLQTLHKPLDLLTPAKKIKPFDIAQVLESVVLNKDGDVPVIEIKFSVQGWDGLAYRFLKDMAREVKTNPKGMPRSYRAYANMMHKLTEHPTGNGKADNARKIVIDRAVEQLAQGLRDELTRRIHQFDMVGAPKAELQETR